MAQFLRSILYTCSKNMAKFSALLLGLECVVLKSWTLLLYSATWLAVLNTSRIKLLSCRIQYTYFRVVLTHPADRRHRRHEHNKWKNTRHQKTAFYTLNGTRIIGFITRTRQLCKNFKKNLQKHKIVHSKAETTKPSTNGINVQKRVPLVTQSLLTEALYFSNNKKYFKGASSFSMLLPSRLVAGAVP